MPQQTDTAEVAAIRAVWAGVLNAPIADDADFFALGGNSLAAMSICAGVEEATGSRPRLRVVFDHPRFHEYVHQIAATAQEGP
ncbi:acyl carrier protein [Catenulispora subtropica]|uniref:Carrier domain-containing protein n=1 Tax=Catenulispora subtropica TaxID=450798 RepID=A0ABP5ERS6_9ACTN